MLETASEYAKVRVQFGRPIGQFQAIKHALADMLVGVEQTAAVAWDAAAAWGSPAVERSEGHDDDLAKAGERSLSARVAGSVSIEASAHAAKECIQILGGIGFTWEHDAHFYLKRAMATRLIFADPGTLDYEVATLALDGARRGLYADLPPEAETRRAVFGPLVQQIATRDPADQRAALVETGTGPWRTGPHPGARRRSARSAGHRRRDGRGQSGPAPSRGGCVGVADHHRPRDRRTTGALGPTHPARSALMVSALQRTGCRV